MYDHNSLFQTSLARENNPKAVFLGGTDEQISYLAQYLAERNVELFSGKNLDDALFGDYFFYIGEIAIVKPLIDLKYDKLPKTIIMCPAISAHILNQYQGHKYAQIKFVQIGNINKISQNQAKTIIDFLLGSNEQFLKLTEVVNLKPIIKPLHTETVTKQAPEIAKIAIPISPQQTNETKKVDLFFSQSDTKTTSEARAHLSTNNQIKNVAISVVLAILLLLFIPITLFITETSVGIFNLNQGKNKILAGQVDQAKTNLSISKFCFSSAQGNLLLLEPIFDITKQPSFFEELSQVVKIGEDLNTSLINLDKTADSVKELVLGITGQKQGVAFATLINSIKGDLSQIDTKLAQVEAEANGEKIANFIKKPLISKLFTSNALSLQKISDLRQSLISAKNIVTVLPDMIGLYQKRTYLLVFQNNMEIRPTGGFIGSYGLVNFSDGSLQNINIDDVYAADGMLKGHVDPPLPISSYLQQEHWYMRDSNWDPDFENSATKILWFLEKELDIKADGVIAIDISAIENLLSATGEVNVPDFSEKIDSSNLYSKAQSHTQTDFFPGSKQKRDFLGSLARSLIGTLMSENNSFNVKIVEQLQKSLAQKHLLFYSTNPSTENLFQQINWAGKIGHTTTCQGSCYQDYLQLVEANLGVNKVNYYVDKQIDQNIQAFTDNTLKHKLNIVYKNNSMPDNVWGGDYKNYLRILLPADIKVQTATLNGLDLKMEKGKIASNSSYLIEPVDGFTSVGFWLDVKPQSQLNLSLEYQSKIPAISGEQNWSYSLLIQKQPGIKADKLNLNIDFGTNWRIVDNQTKPYALVNGGKITYNDSLLQDQYLTTSLQPY